MEGKGRVLLTDRSELVLDGALGVLSFDEGFVAVKTELGEINVEGEGLRIENLSKEKGEILIRGTVTAIYYKASKRQRR